MNLDKIINLANDNNIAYKLNEPLSKYTSFKIGGNVDLLLNPKSTNDIKNIINICNNEKINYFILGKGSNILASDKGYRGAIICTKNLNEIKLINENTIIVGSGANLSKVSTFAYTNCLSGLEFVFGIPGTIGGAVYMNAGAYGGEMKDVVSETTFINEKGEIETKKGEEHLFSYRKSVFSNRNICILDTILKLKSENKGKIKINMDEFSNKRVKKQPLEFPSAGSVFKRPVGFYAGKLIEDCGLKGLCVGGAKVSEKHSGFIINAGNASCNDVLQLIDIIKQEVFKKYGVLLECEIVKLGE